MALTKIGRFGINFYSWQIGSLTYPHVTQSARLIGRAADDIIGKASEAQTPNSLIDMEFIKSKVKVTVILNLQ